MKQNLDERNDKVLKRSIYKLFTMSLVFLSLPFLLTAQFQPEDIDRGVVAVQNGENVYVGWRYLGTESDTVGYNLYRITDATEAVKINDTIITGSTNYIDTSVVVTSTNAYFVTSVENGNESVPSDTVGVLSKNFKTIPLQRPSGSSNASGSYSYSPNDASIGDVDGDGKYEIILKWDPSNSKDNSQSGYTGNVFIDAYEMDGTLLWRIDLGINIRAGAHYTQFLVYDFDGDGKSEVVLRTAPGTKDATGNYLKLGPAATANHSEDNRNSSGYVLKGAEYLTVFEGATGVELATVDFEPARGRVSDWGDSYGNRVDRFNATAAYVNGEYPSIIMCRGYYEKTTLAAWDYRNGELTMRWKFDSRNGYRDYEGQGNHNLSTGDVDNDGKDEIIYGAMAIDDDGTPLHNTYYGHGDAIHFGDLIPDIDGYEVFAPSEEAGYTGKGGKIPGCYVRKAETGEIIWEAPVSENKDVGRALSADITAEYLGEEYWASSGLGVFNSRGEKISDNRPTINFAIWWDGDLLRELLDENIVTKWPSKTMITAYNCSSNNGSKSTPCLQADLFGDWREEFILRTSDNNNLRIYTTSIPTKYRIPTLMHDPVYRLGITWQNSAYNQPPHTGFYLGAGMFEDRASWPPYAPKNVVSGSSSDFIQLNWDKNLEYDLAGYNVYRSDSVMNNFHKLNDSILTDLTYRDSSIIIDVQYFYYIEAVDLTGNTSEPSESVTEFVTLKPDWPEGLSGTYASNKAYLYWNASDNANVVGYNLYRSDESGANYTKVNTNLITETNYPDLDVKNGKVYYFTVTAVDNEDRESFYSAEYSLTPATSIVLQAEDFSYDGGTVDSNNEGFNGTGFFNYGTDGYVEFKGIFGGARGGWYWLYERHALGKDARTGILIVNGVSQDYTMVNTTEFTNYIEDSVKINLNPGFDNVIRFEATGSDFGNLDQIRIGKPTTGPVGVETVLSDLSKRVTIAPNPFKDNVNINLYMDEPSVVSVDILNSLGQRVSSIVTDKYTSENFNHFSWNGISNNGSTLENGMYFCRIIIDNKQVIMKRILLNK